MTDKVKVKIRIPANLLDQIEKTLKPDETLDTRLENLIKRGMKIEGVI